MWPKDGPIHWVLWFLNAIIINFHVDKSSLKVKWVQSLRVFVLFLFKQSWLLRNSPTFKEIFHMCNRKFDDPDNFTISLEFASFFFHPPSLLGLAHCSSSLRARFWEMNVPTPTESFLETFGRGKNIYFFLLERFFPFVFVFFSFIPQLMAFWSICFAPVLIRPRKEKEKERTTKPSYLVPPLWREL